MSASYRSILNQNTASFPQPVSDRIHDAYFVFSILRALDQIDGMKSAVPVLGQAGPLDYERSRSARIADEPSTVEAVTAELVRQFEGLPIWGHPRAQMNVVTCSSIASIIGVLLPAIYNPNLVFDDTARGIMVAESGVAAVAAALIGYEPEISAGVFTFAGTGTREVAGWLAAPAPATQPHDESIAELLYD